MDDRHATALADFHDAFLLFASSFDPQELAPSARGDALAKLAQMEKALSSMGMITGSLMALEPVGPLSRPGHIRPLKVRAVASRCAALWGIPASEAKKVLVTGFNLVSQPEVLAAAREGNLSRSQARAVSEAVRDDPQHATLLIEAARHKSVRGLVSLCKFVRAGAQGTRARGPGTHTDHDNAGIDVAADSGPGQKGFRSWVDGRGNWYLSACGTREDGEKIMSALRQFLPAGVISSLRTPRSKRDTPLFPMASLVALAEHSVRSLPGPLPHGPVTDEQMKLSGSGTVGTSQYPGQSHRDEVWRWVEDQGPP